jgi:hypothetical protein
VSTRSVVMANGKKVDVSKQGLNSIKNPTVQLNLMGQSKTMKAKDWVDPQGRKGKVGTAPSVTAVAVFSAKSACLSRNCLTTNRQPPNLHCVPAGLRRVPLC